MRGEMVAKGMSARYCHVPSFWEEKMHLKDKTFNAERNEFLPCSTKEEVVIFDLQSQQHGWVQCITLGQFESLPVVRHIVNLDKEFYLLLHK